jgi:hypothetical protein
MFNLVKLFWLRGGQWERDHLEDLGVDGRKIINRMGGMTGLVWLRIATGGALF